MATRPKSRKCTNNALEQYVSPEDFPELLSGDEWRVCGEEGALEMPDFAKKPILRVRTAKRNVFDQWEM